MRRWNAHSRWLVRVLLFVVVALVTAACSGTEDSADTTFAASATTGAQLNSGGGDGGGVDEAFDPEFRSNTPASSGPPADALGSDGIDPVVFQVTDLGREVIFTADLTVAVTDVAAAGDTATQEIAALGGFLFGQRTTGAPDPASILTFKVLPEDFPEALDRLEPSARCGHRTSRPATSPDESSTSKAAS